VTTGAHRGALGLLVLVSLLAAAAPATADQAGALASAPDVPRLLERASAAQHQLAYSGTQIVSSWSPDQTGSALLDVVHEPGRGLTTRPHDADSGTTGEVHDDDLTTPDQPSGTAYLAEAAEGMPAPLSLLLAHYAVALDQGGQVAGRPVTSLVLRRGARPAARLWLDDATGLLLRREVYDMSGRTTGAMAFLEVTITPSATTAARRAAPSTRTPAEGAAAVRRAGWACPSLIGSDLVLYDARTVSEPSVSPIMHLSYSDGLSSLSVFQQRGRLDPAALAGYDVQDVGGHRLRVRHGLQTQAVWQSGDTVVTVITDQPAWQLADVVAAMPASQNAGGWLTSASRTVLSAARWLTPLR